MVYRCVDSVPARRAEVDVTIEATQPAINSIAITQAVIGGQVVRRGGGGGDIAASLSRHRRRKNP